MNSPNAQKSRSTKLLKLDWFSLSLVPRKAWSLNLIHDPYIWKTKLKPGKLRLKDYTNTIMNQHKRTRIRTKEKQEHKLFMKKENFKYYGKGSDGWQYRVYNPKNDQIR